MLSWKYRVVFNRSGFLILFSASILSGISILVWYFLSQGYFCSYAITYDKRGYPLIAVELQGQSCQLAVDVGSRFPLFLGKEMLDGLDKQPQGVAEWHNISGQKREAPAYLIPKMQVGNLTLKNIVANEIAEKDRSTLGKFLGEEFNLLLDFPHNCIIACDTFSKLQDKKLVEKDWIKIPFELKRGGILLRMDTSLGTHALALNTTSTISVLRSSLVSVKSSFPFVPSSLSFGKHQLGNITFESIDLPDGLDEIDGFIGMDFLKEHPLYLDYTHKIAYVKPPERYFERIPVTFTDCNTPVVDVSIEDNTYPLELDLGSSSLFSVREEILQNIHKTKYATVAWHDFRGQKYTSPAYTIPEIKINNLRFIYARTRQNREDFYVNVRMNGPPLQPIGAIGLPILEKYNLFLDFPHSAIYASRDHLCLQEAGLLSQNFLTIPFTIHPDGIFLSVETDIGTYRLMLDTGATRIVIRSPHPASTNKFCIMGYDFGKYSIAPLDVSPQFDFDGFLGMDFLCEYSLFIDYSNKVILIDLDLISQ